MAEVIVCDKCGKRIGRLGLRVVILRDGSESVSFYQRAWNGGDYCSRACLIAAVERIEDPPAEEVAA